MAATAMEAALLYAHAGALVLPLHTPTPTGCSCRSKDCTTNISKRGKHPRCLNGKDDATTNTKDIERWWGMWPHANVGVRPHPGIIVLDVDPRNGGAVSLLALQDEHEVLPQTRTARTGGGGLHIWLGLAGQTRGKLAEGIDVKSHTGYVVMPPSLHASGRRYSWINDTRIQPAPQWVVELLAPATIPMRTTSRSSPARAEALLKVVRTAPVGERNNRLFWACSRALECGLDVNPLVQAAVSIGLSEAEAIRTAASAAGRLGVSA